MQDCYYYLGFNLVSGIGPARLDRLIAFFGSLEEAWQASTGDLMMAGLDGRTADALIDVRKRVDLEAEYQRITRSGVRIISRDDALYPSLLRELVNGPPLIYVRGTLTENDRWAIAVVGTRQATTYGRDVTRKLVAELASAGVTIVSGLALGIDAVAHEAALRGGGRTLAVLGSGVDRVYPTQNRPLAQAILGQGAIISEYPLGTQPTPTNFPARNRIISGLSLGVLVVEAAARSGALITVQFALEQGRDVLAVPGSIFSAKSEGPHRLIRDGATIVTRAEDVLQALNMQHAVEQQAITAAVPETPEEVALLKLVEAEPRHIDAISRDSDLAPPIVSATLAMLELKGLVKQVGGMQYVLAR
jgi:DNA processing protein